MIQGVLTRRVLLMMTGALVLIFATQTLTRNWFEIPQLMELERELDRREVDLARAALDRRLGEIAIITSDYSVWDDTYAFMEAAPGSAEFDSYLSSNLVVSTHQNLKLNGMAFFGVDRSLHHFSSYDFRGGRRLEVQPMSLDSTLNHALAPADRPLSNPEFISAGFQQTEVGPVLYAASEILRSDGSGEPRGTLISWQRFDQAFAGEVRDELDLSITFYPVNVAASEPSLRGNLQALKTMAADGFTARNRNGDLHWLIRSIEGDPLFLVRQQAPQRMFETGWWSWSFLVAFGMSTLVLAGIGWVFSRRVIGPLNSAGRVLREISETDDYELRLAPGPSNEIGQLFAFVNKLLTRIQTQQLELREQNQRLEILSQQDPLTRVANRRFLDGFLGEAWAEGFSKQKPLAIALIDIDFFKAFNDTYGHQSGDRVLRTTAETLDAHLHAGTDFLARYGGEEFCAVLRDTEIEAATRVCERLRRVVEEQGIENVSSAAAPVVTVSIGVASTVPRPGVSCAQLLSAADQALYAAKAQGRNRVCTGQLEPAQAS